jgi:glutathione S-transferase
VTIKIYGPTASRAARALWMVNELGVPFEHIALEMKDLKNPDYIKINPNGKVPAMIDGDLTLFESMAINLYLAKKYNKDGMWPSSIEDQARAYQWSFWAMTEIEARLLTVLINRMFLPDERRDPEAADEAEKQLQPALRVLDHALAATGHLAGNEFTVADLNVASVMSWARLGRVNLSRFPQVDEWLTAALQRPAAIKAAPRRS